MPSEDETSIEKAFAEFHRRIVEETPPSPQFRERALKMAASANERRETDARSVGRLRLLPSLATAVILVLGFALVWIVQRPKNTAQSDRVAVAIDLPRVEQLIAEIERTLETYGVFYEPVYHTDYLLTQIETQPTP